MTPPAPPPDGRPLRAVAAAAVALVLVAGAVAAWRFGAQAARPAQPEIPPAPAIRENLLVATGRPVPAPALLLPTVGGGRFSLAEARGQVVVVNFWATWCGPCTQEIPSLVQLGRSLAAYHPGKFRIVAVSIDEDPAAVTRFFAAPPFGALPPELTVALEPGGGPISRAFHCQGRGACRAEDVRFPETYVIDQQGRIVAMVVGFIDWSTPGSQRFLEALLGG